jgi:hypothetical protein
MRTVKRLLSLVVFAIALGRSSWAQDQGEMINVRGSFVALTPPAAFFQIEDPEETFFTPGAGAIGKASAFLHLNFIRACKTCQYKSLGAFIRFDVDDFLKRYPKGSAKFHSKLKLGRDREPIPLSEFQSAADCSAYEHIAFIPTGAKNLVLLVALSAKDKESFARYLRDYVSMLRSYKGVIVLN